MPGEEEEVLTGIALLLSKIGDVVTWIFGKIPTMLDAIVDNDLLLLAVGVAITGTVIAVAISIFKRV